MFVLKENSTWNIVFYGKEKPESWIFNSKLYTLEENEKEYNECVLKDLKASNRNRSISAIQSLEKIHEFWKSSLLSQMFFSWVDSKKEEFYKKQFQEYQELYKKTLTDIELISATELLFDWYYLVNITSDNGKKIAEIFYPWYQWYIEYDKDRWDKIFQTYEEAKEYADTFNS